MNSLDLLVAEASQRGIAIHTWPEIQPGVARLNYEEHQEFLYHSQTDLLGRVTARIFSNNKALTSRILQEAGFPVPADILVTTEAEALAFLQAHQRIVIKPLDGEGGRGVTPNITQAAEIAPAFKLLAESTEAPTDRIVCQQHVVGREYRVLVVNQTEVFVVERLSARVTGDGTETVEQLLATYNSTRRPEYQVAVDHNLRSILSQQGLTLATPAPAGHEVRLAYVANAHAGGTVRAAAAEIGEAARTVACQVAAYFKCPLVGLDIITPDITKDIGYIIELNAAPDLTLHHLPDEGEAQDVAHSVIDMLFPETKSSI